MRDTTSGQAANLADVAEPEEIKRRRLAALAVVAALAAGGGVAVGAGGGDGEPEREGCPDGNLACPNLAAVEGGGATTATDEREAPARPTNAQLQREAGQTIVLRFAGTSVPGYVLNALRERRAAGVILFSDNITSRGQLRSMTRAMHRAAGGRTLIMTDQEGGEVRRIPWAAPSSSPARLRSAAAVRSVAAATARDLRADGINVNLAPVADVGTWPGSVMRSRAFPGGGEAVGEAVAATVRGYARGGILATVKHFPGLGRSTKNTDFDLARIPGSGDLAPFRAAIAADVPLVMPSHALHPELDRDRIVSQSRRVLTGLLRDELGFEGTCVTDSLEAQAVVRRSSTAIAADRSMRAGCDLMLTTGPGSYLQVLRRFVAQARGDERFRARLAQARERIAALPLRGD